MSVLHPLGSHLPPIVHRLSQGDRVPQDQRMNLTFVLASDPGVAGSAPVDPATYDALKGHLERSGFTVTEWPTRLIMDAAGEAGAVADLLGTPIYNYHSPSRQSCFAPHGHPALPRDLASHIVGVAGLDNLATARPHLHAPVLTEQAANGGRGFYPKDIAGAYDVPPGLDGSGFSIGLLEFSNGYNPSDLSAFWQQHGINRTEPRFVSVDGTANDQGQQRADQEATLDTQWAGAMAPGADLVVYEASAGSSDATFARSLMHGIHAAMSDANAPTVLSISYGDAESHFSSSVLLAFEHLVASAASQGICTIASSGDQGSFGIHAPDLLGSVHVDFPASAPHVTAVGGTRLQLVPQREETAWTDINGNGATGGGISQVFNVPRYQSSVHLPSSLSGAQTGRGLPDLALNADPDTGYQIVFQGAPRVIGGTSASAPVWAAFLTLVHQALSAGTPPAFFQPVLYQTPISSTFSDITSGNNRYGSSPGYSAGPGWDAVTGFGSPHLSALISALSGNRSA